MERNKPTTWTDEDVYWRTNYSGRPYASGRAYDDFRPGYQYGFESAQRYRGREWQDIQKELESGWNKWEQRGKRAWHDVQHAVRDAWERVTGRERQPVH